MGTERTVQRVCGGKSDDQWWSYCNWSRAYSHLFSPEEHLHSFHPQQATKSTHETKHHSTFYWNLQTQGYNFYLCTQTTGKSHQVLMRVESEHQIGPSILRYKFLELPSLQWTETDFEKSTGLLIISCIKNEHEFEYCTLSNTNAEKNLKKTEDFT